jgi:acyl-[acyl-carrier-protein]-phospholipid O-acyltransferase/long-chain-fatty-acid--[acyl-carrier-protein] ligase
MTGKNLVRDFFRGFVASVIRCIYQVRALNTINVPAEGGVLMVSNHVTYVDAFMISLACPRPVRFVIVDHFLKVKFFAWFLRLFDTVPISPSRAKEAIRTAADAVATTTPCINQSRAPARSLRP